eukprot:gb/GEZN01019471.1/.p1 GENE.gb/GEZN01019471.1/~~gb/GEZN01019471.1/.p1  ORF type:complete len:213 (+),score=18.69 gb/GEZN01019471.1/:26-664(+)
MLSLFALFSHSVSVTASSYSYVLQATYSDSSCSSPVFILSFPFIGDCSSYFHTISCVKVGNYYFKQKCATSMYSSKAIAVTGYPLIQANFGYCPSSSYAMATASGIPDTCFPTYGAGYVYLSCGKSDGIMQLSAGCNDDCSNCVFAEEAPTSKSCGSLTPTFPSPYEAYSMPLKYRTSDCSGNAASVSVTADATQQKKQILWPKDLRKVEEA